MNGRVTTCEKVIRQRDFGSCFPFPLFCLVYSVEEDGKGYIFCDGLMFERDRERERHTHTETDRQTDRQTDRDKQTGGQTEESCPFD